MSHPDEGLIHAWLDGELDAAEAARVESLVKFDPAWAAAAADARGFIAASSRVLGKLDDVPANVVPATAVAHEADAAASGSTNVTRLRQSQQRTVPWWTIRVAAMLVVATGTVFVVQRVSPNDAVTIGEPVVIEPAPASPLETDAIPTIGASPRTTGASAPTAGAVAPTIGAIAQPKISTLGVAAAESELKDARARTGGAAVGATASSRANIPAAATEVTADKARRDVAEAGKVADEKRVPTIGTAAAAPAAGGGLRKEASALSLQSVVTTSVAALDCFRETNPAAGSAPVTHRVRITSDSTAVAIVPGAPPGVAAAAGQVAMRQMAATPAPALRLRGDTLFVGVVGGVTRIALRVTCPAP